MSMRLSQEGLYEYREHFLVDCLSGLLQRQESSWRIGQVARAYTREKVCITTSLE